MIILLPLLDPCLDAVNIAVHLVRRVALELDDDVLVVGLARLLEEHVHDFRVEVLLQLHLGVFSVSRRAILLAVVFSYSMSRT